ncbi:MAG: hypothetical protein EHM19_13560, partial [Candidatus Latescibacterota bacterium]
MSSEFIVVAVPVPTRREFTYRAPAGRSASDCVGRRVLVPFGARRKLVGVVVRATNDPPPAEAKEALEVLDDEPVVSATMLDLTRWIADYYLTSWGETLRAALPLGDSRHGRTEVWVEVLPEGCLDGAEKTLRANAVRQIECLLYLREKRRVRASQLARFGNAALALEKRGFVRRVREEISLLPEEELPDGSPIDPALTPEQARALAPVEAAIRAGRFETHLLHGITGSGKT